MKLLFATVLIGVLISINSFAAKPKYPELFFQYSGLYDDTVCPPPHTVKQEWADEAAQREPEFKKMWEADAPTLWKNVFKNFKKGFQRKELTATLSVCTESWSYSNPLVLRALNFLKSFRADKPVWENYKFVNQTFHELLHTWLVDNFKFSDSALLTKYKNELPGVKFHLHLMAIQKLVYLQTGRKDMLDWIGELYPAMQNSPETRAWEIVNKIEGYEPFIKEIKEQTLIKERSIRSVSNKK